MTALYFFNVSYHTRLLNFDFNYLNGFPDKHRVVFAAEIALGWYIFRQIYFPVEAVKLAQLVNSILLQKDADNYLLDPSKPKHAFKTQITQSTMYVLYIFQLFTFLGGKDLLLILVFIF